MVTKSKLLVVLVVVAIAGVAAASLFLRGYLRCAGFAGPGVTVEELPPPVAGGTDLRLVTWNMRNFPLDERPQADDLGYSRRTNICDFEKALGGLDADLYGLQEVNDIRRFQPILKRACGKRMMQVRFSPGGGRFGQHLAIAWDDAVLELIGEPMEISGLVLEPGMRPAFAGYLRSRRVDGVDFTLVVVHLDVPPLPATFAAAASMASTSPWLWFTSKRDRTTSGNAGARTGRWPPGSSGGSTRSAIQT